VIFQFFLILALIALALYSYSQWRRSPAVSVSVFALAVLGMALASAPDLATDLARLVGIGRGADLVIYCFVLISLVAIFNLHLKLRASDSNTTEVVRALAILTAQSPREKSGTEQRVEPVANLEARQRS
jgi:hypothetical protein